MISNKPKDIDNKRICVIKVEEVPVPKLKVIWLKNQIDQDSIYLMQLDFLGYEYFHAENVNQADDLLNKEKETSFLVILPGSLGKSKIEEINEFSNVKCIIIFCFDETKYKSFAEAIPKIVIITSDFDKIQTYLQSLDDYF